MVGMKLLNIETPVTRNIIPQILLNVQDFYFHKVGYTSYDEGIFGRYTDLRNAFWNTLSECPYLKRKYKLHTHTHQRVR
jgi:hypothetical protein